MKIAAKIATVVFALSISACTALAAQASVVPDGTSVPVQLQDNLFSGVQTEGQVIHFKTTADVTVPDRGVVIPQGSDVTAKVLCSHKAGMVGQPGKLSFAPESAKLANGTDISFRHDEFILRGGDNRVGAVVLTCIAWPCFCINGGNGKAHAGQTFTFVTGPADAPGQTVASN
ncbi:MAG: hypothetical protein P4L33_00185 [Capsulimonadaceae bacterium]|nr:hypothetical protein [Capsulimonadaceae bacterium]